MNSTLAEKRDRREREYLYSRNQNHHLSSHLKMRGCGWILCCWLVWVITLQAESITWINITILESAVAKGAVCLDGSPAAFYYYEGFGAGSWNWMFYLEGGAWCNSEKGCVWRSRSYLGSSQTNRMPTMRFDGLLDDDCTINPDFCDWHKVYVHYCDGSSFQSDIDEINPQNNLNFRGARIFHAMVDEFIARGMGDAQNALLSGSSAGGLATILHCDTFRALLPGVSRVKCLSDSGFFIHGEGLPALQLRETEFGQHVIETHRLATVLPATCTSRRNPNLCLFPEYLVADIQTPLFIIESAFDSYQVENNLFKGIYHTYEYKSCINNLSVCNATLTSLLRDFGITFIRTLVKLDPSPSRGMFIHPCFRHAHIFGSIDGWTCSFLVDNVLANKGIGEAVGDWYYDRQLFQGIDLGDDVPLNCTSVLTDQRFYDECRAYLPGHI